VRTSGRTGPLEEDAFGEVVTPWVVGQNEQLRLQLEHLGFPELIPQLVQKEPALSTWEDVQKVAWKFARDVGRFLEGDFFAAVRNLDRV
jgi:hypothetical protein